MRADMTKQTEDVRYSNASENEYNGKSFSMHAIKSYGLVEV
jgi:hypothetical protein